MDVKKRSEAISCFKESSDEPKVLIVSLKAGGVGLNVGHILACLESWMQLTRFTADQCQSRLHGRWCLCRLRDILFTRATDGLLVELGH